VTEHVPADQSGLVVDYELDVDALAALPREELEELAQALAALGGGGQLAELRAHVECLLNGTLPAAAVRPGDGSDQGLGDGLGRPPGVPVRDGKPPIMPDSGLVRIAL
jgi:hypothetical protein